jgi:transposase
MPPHLLPDPAHLRLEYLSADADLITVTVSAKAAEARCPLCDHPTHRIHSRYRRTLADLPWNGVAVRLSLTVRRLSVRHLTARDGSSPSACRIWLPPTPVGHCGLPRPWS